MAKAILRKLSVCECGFWLLDESIPLGTVYEAYPDNIGFMRFVCGGCGKLLTRPAILFKSCLRPNDPPMPLPVDAFELVEDSKLE